MLPRTFKKLPNLVTLLVTRIAFRLLLLLLLAFSTVLMKGNSLFYCPTDPWRTQHTDVRNWSRNW